MSIQDSERLPRLATQPSRRQNIGRVMPILRLELSHYSISKYIPFYRFKLCSSASWWLRKTMYGGPTYPAKVLSIISEVRKVH